MDKFRVSSFGFRVIKTCKSKNLLLHGFISVLSLAKPDDRTNKNQRKKQWCFYYVPCGGTNHSFLFFFFALCFSSLTFATDLLQIYRQAQSNDAVYGAARASLLAGRERLPQGRALVLPSLNLEANTAYNSSDVSYRSDTLTPAQRNFNSRGYTLTLTQPIFRMQNFAQYQQAPFQVAQAEATFVQAEHDLIIRVTQAYFDILAAQNNLEFIQTQKQAISEQLAQAQRNFEVGTATITDTHEAKARYDLAVAQEIAAQNELEIRKYALQQIIGKTPDVLQPVGGSISLPLPEPNNMEKWVEQAQTSNPAVQIQEALLEIANREINRNRAGHFPSLDFVATYGKNSAGGNTSTTGVGNDIDFKTVGVQLTLPLYAGGATQSKLREAVALQEKARQDLENARRSSAMAARQSFLNVTNGIAQVNALDQALVSSQSALDSNKLGYEVGVRINIDVLNAQQQFYSTKRDLARARYDTIVNQLRLKAAAGILNEDDLKQVNALFLQ